MLNVSAPVLAYAHIHIGLHGEIVEHCPVHETIGDAQRHLHPSSDKRVAPHCPYCPGFSAGAAFCQGVAPGPTSSMRALPAPDAVRHLPAGRSSIRLAQSRAPPTAD